MEGILAFLIMTKIDLIINFLKKIIFVTKQALKTKRFSIREEGKELLEIIIFKASVALQHTKLKQIKKKVIEFDYFFTKFILSRAPLIKGSKVIIRKNINSVFLNRRN